MAQAQDEVVVKKKTKKHLPNSVGNSSGSSLNGFTKVLSSTASDDRSTGSIKTAPAVVKKKKVSKKKSAADDSTAKTSRTSQSAPARTKVIKHSPSTTKITTTTTASKADAAFMSPTSSPKKHLPRTTGKSLSPVTNRAAVSTRDDRMAAASQALTSPTRSPQKWQSTYTLKSPSRENSITSSPAASTTLNSPAKSAPERGVRRAKSDDGPARLSKQGVGMPRTFSMGGAGGGRGMPNGGRANLQSISEYDENGNHNNNDRAPRRGTRASLLGNSNDDATAPSTSVAKPGIRPGPGPRAASMMDLSPTKERQNNIGRQNSFGGAGGRGPGPGRGGRGPGIPSLMSRSSSLKNMDSPAKMAMERRPSYKRVNSGARLGGNNGDPPPKSRRDFTRGPPPRARSSDLELMIRTPSGRDPTKRSQSGDLEVLRSSMHRSTHRPPGPSILKNSSHHPRRSNSRDPAHRVQVKSNRQLARDEEEVPISFDSKPRPKLERGKSKNKSLMDLSGHSFMTTRSLMSVDHEEFEDDPAWKRVLRFLRILPPHKNEKPLKKRIRILTWTVLSLDFLAAIVSIATYNGVPTCCGIPIFNMAIDGVDWNKVIRISAYVYMFMILAEVIPVIRKGLPFNLINPVVGFCITFGMFFDDRVVGAVCMWILEASAIVGEFLVYRCKSALFHEKLSRLTGVDEDLTKHKSLRRLQSAASLNISSDDDDDSDSQGSFEEDLVSSDPEIQKSSGHSRNSESSFSGDGNYKLRENRLLRERRVLRATIAEERLHLRYHFGGVVVNFGLVCISLILIIAIAKSGGLCIRNDERPVVFSYDQLSRCPLCQGSTGKCQKGCENPDGHMECYQAYY